jgi:flagellar biosynthesis/type III secretory pathway protein FliH
MAWFERERRRSDKAAPARFADVGAPERRLPSWLAKGEPERHSPSARPGGAAATDAAAPLVRHESERFRTMNERPGSIRAGSRQPSRPPSRASMSPSELESLIAERAAQRASTQLMEDGRTALSEAIESIDQARRDMLYGAEQRLIELAVLIARRVIARELKTQPELVADLVREGVDALAASDKIRVQLGTGFAVAAVMVSEQLATKGIEVDLGISAAISEFGCIVETDIGRVDESIESRVDAVLEAIDTETKE